MKRESCTQIIIHGYENSSAAVSTYQKDEEAKKSKFPTVFWLKNDISKNEQE